MNKLQKPYTQTQKYNFIVENNHRLGMHIEETDTALYALEPYEILNNDKVISAIEAYEARLEQEKQARIQELTLTGADVERAIYKAKGMDFEDILAMVAEVPTIDVKALRIEFKANNFYRKNPYIDSVGTLLGFTKEQLDKFFDDGNSFDLEVKTNAWKNLLDEEVLINEENSQE